MLRARITTCVRESGGDMDYGQGVGSYALPVYDDIISHSNNCPYIRGPSTLIPFSVLVICHAKGLSRDWARHKVWRSPFARPV